MLEALKEGLMSIVDFFTSIGEFISDIVLNTLNFVEAFSEVMLALPDWLDYFPSFLLIAILPLFTIVLVLRLVGRG